MIENLIIKNILEYILLLNTTNLSAIIVNKMRLNKISKYDGCIIKNGPFIDDKTFEERKEEINKEKIKILLPLIEKLSNYTSKENLNTIYKNLSTVKIKRNPFMILSGASASYTAKKNIIKYFFKSSLGHELLHLASAYYNLEDNESYVGFKQQKGIAIIGKGLNEGYTELLASRIYNNKNKVTAYKKEVRIAGLLEFFFDNPKDMENYYFNHNLPGFIHHMEQFAKREEVIKLILDIDNINFLSTGTPNPFPTYHYIKTQLTLYKWFNTKKNNLEKQQQFKNLICKNKLASLVLNNQTIKLCRTSPYETQSDLHNEHKTK